MGSSVLVIKQRSSPSLSPHLHQVLTESPCCSSDCGLSDRSSLPPEERDNCQQFFPPFSHGQNSGRDRSHRSPRYCLRLHPPRYPLHLAPGRRLRGWEEIQPDWTV